MESLVILKTIPNITYYFHDDRYIIYTLKRQSKKQ